MRVPEAVGDGDAAGPGFDQAAGHEELIVPLRGTVALVLGRTLAVAIAQGRGLLVHVQCFDELAGGEHIEGPLVVRVQGTAISPIELVELPKQAFAVLQLGNRDSLRPHHRETVAVHLGRHGGSAKRSRCRAVVRLVLHDREKVHERRNHRVGRPLHLGDDRPDVRLVLALRDVHAVAGHALEAAVLVLLADHGADHRQLIHAAGQPRQMLADLDAGNLVAIGLNSPRISAGAFGLRSKVS